MEDAAVAFMLDKYKIDIEKDSGEAHHNLPVPAVYVVDNEKKIHYNYVNPDYKIRVDHNIILSEVKSMLK